MNKQQENRKGASFRTDVGFVKNQPTAHFLVSFFFPQFHFNDGSTSLQL